MRLLWASNLSKKRPRRRRQRIGCRRGSSMLRYCCWEMSSLLWINEDHPGAAANEPGDEPIWEVLFCVVVLSGFAAGNRRRRDFSHRPEARSARTASASTPVGPIVPSAGEPRIAGAARPRKSWRQALWGGWTWRGMRLRDGQVGPRLRRSTAAGEMGALEADEKPRRKRHSPGSCGGTLPGKSPRQRLSKGPP